MIFLGVIFILLVKFWWIILIILLGIFLFWLVIFFSFLFWGLLNFFVLLILVKEKGWNIFVLVLDLVCVIELKRLE